MQAHFHTPLSKAVRHGLAGVVVCCLLAASFLNAQPVEEGTHAEEAKKDLKALHTAMVRCLEASEGVWPEMPEEIVKSDDEKVVYDWMSKILKDHGATDADLKLSTDADPRPISYLMTDFVREPMTAYRWRGQPWFILMVPIKPVYMITAEGKPMRSKELSELQPLPGTPKAYIDPEMQGMCPIEAVPAKLRPLFETVSKSWKDKQ